MTYAEKLKDPRWQKRRLEIFQRDDWKCIYCGNGTKELQVHHVLYLNGRDPWEYDENHLVTACCDCHLSETLMRSEDSTLVGMMNMAGVSRRNLFSLSTELRRFIRESGVPYLQYQKLMDFLYANG